MSKIGKLPVKFPAGVEIIEEKNYYIVKGPKGEVEVVKVPNTKYEIKGAEILTVVKNEMEEGANAYYGLARALMNNAVYGVTEGYLKELELVGVGYRVELQGSDLKLAIGFSHPVVVNPPKGIKFEVEGNTLIKVSGADKQMVGEIAAQIRKIRRPEPYKGKGIRYKDEVVRRKQGKAAKSAG